MEKVILQPKFVLRAYEGKKSDPGEQWEPVLVQEVPAGFGFWEEEFGIHGSEPLTPTMVRRLNELITLNGGELPQGVSRRVARQNLEDGRPAATVHQIGRGGEPFVRVQTLIESTDRPPSLVEVKLTREQLELVGVELEGPDLTLPGRFR